MKDPPRHGRKCSACHHPKLADLNREVVRGTPLNAVARQFGLSQSAVHRHARSHVSEKLRREIAVELTKGTAQAVADDLNGEAVEIKGGLARIVRELEAILNRAKGRGDDPLALVSLKELRATLLDLAQVYGSLKSELTVNVNLNDSPQWLQLRDVLLDVFERHPQAKQDFIERARFLRLEHAR
jgi:hypothetical protein